MLADGGVNAEETDHVHESGGGESEYHGGSVDGQGQTRPFGGLFEEDVFEGVVEVGDR